MKEIIARFDDDNEKPFVYGEDVGEIIRCKDCKSYDIPLEFCWKMLIEREEDDFCSRAKRKEE